MNVATLVISGLRLLRAELRRIIKRVCGIQRNSARSAATSLWRYVPFGKRQRAKQDDGSYQQENEDYRVALDSGLFNREWYLQKNADVFRAGIDPLVHFLNLGAFEGRCPNPAFDSSWYLNTYVDVAASGMNPLVHYIKYGELEGRRTTPLSSIQSFAEREALLADHGWLLAENTHTTDAYNMYWVRHRPIELTAGVPAVTGSSGFDDAELVKRIIASYRIASATDIGSNDSFWLNEFAKIKEQDQAVLLCGDPAEVATLLQNPGRSRLFIGFDELHDHTALPKHGIADVISTHEWLYDGLLRIAEAIGVRRLEYPESLGPKSPPPAVEDLLLDLDRAAGFRITFPNPYPEEVGLATSRGVASFRAIQSLYHAFRICELLSDRSTSRVVEIGAGLGRTAFYAQRFGVENYTIIDLPITNVAQGYFLGRTLGPTAISLCAEDCAGISILPPTTFFDSSDRFELAVNVDSLTEMARDTADSYCRAIAARADTFLSINHECNIFTVRDVCERLGIRSASRMPFWLRRGYLDEVFRF